MPASLRLLLFVALCPLFASAATLEEFHSRQAALTATDVDGHWELARWAQTHGFKSEARAEAELVLQHRPMYEPVRQFLRHEKINGVWYRPEDAVRVKEAEALRAKMGPGTTDRQLKAELDVRNTDQARRKMELSNRKGGVSPMEDYDEAPKTPARTAPPDLSGFKENDGVTIQLLHGGHVTGFYQGLKKNVVSVISEFGEVGVDAGQILSIVPDHIPRSNPANFRPVDPKDVRGQWRRAQRARELGLESTAVAAARLALAVEPANKEIRDFVGDAYLNGKLLAHCEPEKGTPLRKGNGVILEFGEDREITGIYLGQKQGQYWLSVTEGEIYVDIAIVRKIRRISCKRAAFQSLLAGINQSDGQSHWNLSVYAQQRCMRAEADAAAKLAAEMGQPQAQVFVAHPGWRPKMKCSGELFVKLEPSPTSGL